MIVRFPHSGHRRGSRANGNAVTPGSMLCSASGSAIKRINGWREGLPLTVAVKFRSEDGLHPPGKVSLERKKNTALICWKLSLVPHFGRYKSVIRPEYDCRAFHAIASGRFAGAKRIRQLLRFADATPSEAGDHCEFALFSSAGQLTITVSGGRAACSAVSSTRKRCPSRATS